MPRDPLYLGSSDAWTRGDLELGLPTSGNPSEPPLRGFTKTSSTSMLRHSRNCFEVVLRELVGKLAYDFLLTATNVGTVIGRIFCSVAANVDQGSATPCCKGDLFLKVKNLN
jgi:hypothetical protein